MFGSILGAIAGPVIGGLFGGSKSKTQKTTNEVDYVKLRENAEKGGFNPLTALRHGGAAGHMVTTHPALSSPGPGAAIAQGVGNAMQAVGETGPWNVPSAAPTQSHETAANNLTYQILEKQLRHFTTNAPNPRARMGDVPVMEQTAAGVGTRATAKMQQQIAADQTKPMVPVIEAPTIINPYRSDSDMRVDPRLPGAEAAENRFGDFMGNFSGVDTYARETIQNYGEGWAFDWRRGFYNPETGHSTMWWAERPRRTRTTPKFRPQDPPVMKWVR